MYVYLSLCLNCGGTTSAPFMHVEAPSGRYVICSHKCAMEYGFLSQQMKEQYKELTRELHAKRNSQP